MIPNISPEKQRAQYEPLRDYLANQLKVDVELFVAHNYAGVLALLVADQVDVAHLADLLDERVENLSGGQRQRVALARALLGLPRLLLADGTTSGLDPVNAERAVADLTSVRGATVVLSTHDVALAGSLARVVALRAGRIVHDGAPPDARETELIYARGR